MCAYHKTHIGILFDLLSYDILFSLNEILFNVQFDDGKISRYFEKIADKRQKTWEE